MCGKFFATARLTCGCMLSVVEVKYQTDRVEIIKMMRMTMMMIIMTIVIFFYFLL